MNLGNPGRVGERVEVLLVVSAEFEEHDRCALAREAGGGQRVGVVRLQQRVRAQSSGSARPAAGIRARLMMRAVTQDSAQLGHDAANGLGNRRLPRRRVEHPAPCGRGSRSPARSNAVATSCAAPSTTAQVSPGRHRTRHAVCACPFDQRRRASRVRQRDGELRTAVPGRAEIG